jgi:hypothetical protein
MFFIRCRGIAAPSTAGKRMQKPRPMTFVVRRNGYGTQSYRAVTRITFQDVLCLGILLGLRLPLLLAFSRLNHAEVAFELVDFALRRRPHLGFRVAVKRDHPPPLVGERSTAAFCPAVMG